MLHHSVSVRLCNSFCDVVKLIAITISTIIVLMLGMTDLILSLLSPGRPYLREVADHSDRSSADNQNLRRRCFRRKHTVLKFEAAESCIEYTCQ
jgi:hypothetical protein